MWYIYCMHSRAFSYSVEDKYSSLHTRTSVIWLPHANTEVNNFYLHPFTFYWFTCSLLILCLANLTLTVTCFVLGFGLGSILLLHCDLWHGWSLSLSALSSSTTIGFGCLPIYYIILSLYFIFTLSSTLIKNATTLVVICMVTGLLASAPMCNVVRTIADVWEIENCGFPWPSSLAPFCMWSSSFL